MAGRHVTAAPGETCASKRLKSGGHYLLSRQRPGAVSTPERRRQETRERKAMQGIGRSESAAFSERLDFRAARQGQVRRLIRPWPGLHSIPPVLPPRPRGEGEMVHRLSITPEPECANDHRLNTNPTPAVPSP